MPLASPLACQGDRLKPLQFNRRARETAQRPASRQARAAGPVGAASFAKNKVERGSLRKAPCP